MKTDQPIYQFMATGPEAFRVLTGGLTLPGPYRFRSLTLKALERRIDGVFEPEGHAGPVYLVEFQGQFAQTAWYNLMAKVSLWRGSSRAGCAWHSGVPECGSGSPPSAWTQ